MFIEVHLSIFCDKSRQNLLCKYLKDLMQSTKRTKGELNVRDEGELNVRDNVCSVFSLKMHCINESNNKFLLNQSMKCVYIQERKIMDLEENLREKDELIRARTQAVTLMSADLSAKGKSTLDQVQILAFLDNGRQT